MEENLKYLLTYVESPYFTAESVEKEKGIIEQEIKMYQDKPYTRLFEGITYNLFHNYPAKYPIIGTIQIIPRKGENKHEKTLIDCALLSCTAYANAPHCPYGGNGG